PAKCSAEESSQIIRAVLDNEMKGRDAERLVLINAAAALHLAGGEPTLPEAYAAVEECIRSGSAARKLNDIRGATGQ
ncbi:MAG TPA: hypothetical protein VNA17_12155, partial [Pyrinomonadaceae bacterium]|nr:hypothetical protein [Pyrinomonadaceae bacterium]